MRDIACERLCDCICTFIIAQIFINFNSKFDILHKKPGSLYLKSVAHINNKSETVAYRRQFRIILE